MPGDLVDAELPLFHQEADGQQTGRILRAPSGDEELVWIDTSGSGDGGDDLTSCVTSCVDTSCWCGVAGQRCLDEGSVLERVHRCQYQ